MTVKYQSEIIEKICELIRIKSVQTDPCPGAPFGEGVAKSLEYVLTLGKEMGFTVKNLDGYAGYIEYGNGPKLYGIPVHLDVVPEGLNWSVDPYGGVIRDKAIYGRGVVDNKGPAIAVLYALKMIKDMDLPLKNRVRIILGTNEETGKAGLRYYLEKEREPGFSVVPDSKFPVVNGEKGIVKYRLSGDLSVGEKTPLSIIELQGGDAANMVPSYAIARIRYDSVFPTISMKEFCKRKDISISTSIDGKEIILEVFGQSAHGASPHDGVNAVSGLLCVLSFLYGFPKNSKQEIESTVCMLSDRLNSAEGRNVGLSVSDKQSGSLTMNLGTIEMNEGRIYGVVDIRYPVSFEETFVSQNLESHLSGIEIERLSGQEPIYYNEESEEVLLLLDIYKTVTGKELKPVVIG
ncbi:MAG: Sapep family Mn(2+)-dependent dipeptidase, partial [Spirochaetales bacterium]|nr:Sapep family Mn(2+)-dependent dipeptidase [Spirochaetales bacterium]